MPQNFWFFSIRHAAQMMNMIPGKYKGSLASPFMLVHDTPANCCTLVPLFSVCYFNHTKDGNTKRSKNQAHTMDGTVLGRSTASNTLLVYNPRNKSYYQPDSYKIDPYRLPGSIYPTIKYDGGLFCSLYWDTAPLHDEPFPPGTRVECQDPVTRVLQAGTVMDIPMDSSALFIGTLPPRMMNNSLLERAWNVKTQLHECYKQAQ